MVFTIKYKYGRRGKHLEKRYLAKGMKLMKTSGKSGKYVG